MVGKIWKLQQDREKCAYLKVWETTSSTHMSCLKSFAWKWYDSHKFSSVVVAILAVSTSMSTSAEEKVKESP